MSRTWAKGSTRSWRRTRALVLLNNQATNAGRCTLQIPGVCTGQADCVHHTLGKAVTGDDPRHLAAACTACNLHVGDPQEQRVKPRPKRVSNW